MLEIQLFLDTMSDKQNKDALLTNSLLQHRLSVGLGIAGGARGSLHKCAMQLVATASKSASADDATATLPSLLLTDLSLQQIEMTKLILQVQRNEQELQRYQQESDAESSVEVSGGNSSSNIELRQLLLRQQQVKVCLDEYEAMAALTVSQHVASEHSLRFEYDNLERQHAEALRDLDRATAACHIRASQFHLLQQCIQDMKHPIDSDNSAPDHGAVVPTLPSIAKLDAIPANAAVNSHVPDRMEIDEADAAHNDEEGELYGDL
jgi:hypothetical protein